MQKLNFNKPSHIMLCWAGLTITGALVYNVTKNSIYIRKREHAVPSETIPTKVNQLSWEERIAQDEANAAKKGYKVDYRGIHETTAAEAKDV
ncbi:hypothetical protein BKA57DRAFT_503027 [Linnemannia elongata]|nr:hypothetical protein BGZ89_001278 [Linnemannia elongata]KAH7052891.1 hypothetical protein BKA57DRAFT_503027 [Linnemannia elongata]KAK5814633.1 hypothetical protein F5H01DRAFT_368371 [Linnemannia elongata]